MCSEKKMHLKNSPVYFKATHYSFDDLKYKLETRGH